MSDLISRQAAIDAAKKAVEDWDEGYGDDRDEFIAYRLNELPAAQPQRMRGIWECRELNYGAFKTYDFVCSACGKCPPLNYNKEMLLSDFCPNCGADMRGTK